MNKSAKAPVQPYFHGGIEKLEGLALKSRRKVNFASSNPQCEIYNFLNNGQSSVRRESVTSSTAFFA